MEKMLHKLAQQLDSLDEESLLHLWNKYANITNRFEPTREWEESALVFSMIQAKHWKNQLFNYCLARMSRPQPPTNPNALGNSADFLLDAPTKQQKAPQAAEKKSCRILSFHSALSKQESSKDSDNP